MTDTIVQFAGKSNPIPVKVTDNGDGTYSL